MRDSMGAVLRAIAEMEKSDVNKMRQDKESTWASWMNELSMNIQSNANVGNNSKVREILNMVKENFHDEYVKLSEREMEGKTDEEIRKSEDLEFFLFETIYSSLKRLFGDEYVDIPTVYVIARDGAKILEE